MRLVARSWLGIPITGTVNLAYDLGNRIKPGRADKAKP